MTDKSDRPDGDGLRAKLIEFDSFLNEPPSYEDKMMVRDYRHSAYAKWSSLCADIVKLIDAPTRDSAEGAGDVATEQQLRDLFGMDDEDAMTDVIPTHSGQWVKQGSVWWFRERETLSIPTGVEIAPPKPAPDAIRLVRAALMAPTDALRQNADRAHDKLYGFVSPVDGANETAQLLEKAASIALAWKADPAAAFEIRELIPDPSPAVAAEPDVLDAFGWLLEAIKSEGVTLTPLLKRRFEDAEKALLRTVASPPIKGDRETLEAIRQEVVLAIAFLTRNGNTDRITETVRQLIPRLANADERLRAILSLRVQPTRPDHKARANAYSLEKWGVELENLPSDMMDGCYDATFEATNVSQNE